MLIYQCFVLYYRRTYFHRKKNKLINQWNMNDLNLCRKKVLNISTFKNLKIQKFLGRYELLLGFQTLETKKYNRVVGRLQLAVCNACTYHFKIFLKGSKHIVIHMEKKICNELDVYKNREIGKIKYMYNMSINMTSEICLIATQYNMFMQ